MGELIENRENLSKKEALGAYVHDMVDLEIRAFSLRETAKESRKKAKEETAKIFGNEQKIKLCKKKQNELSIEFEHSKKEAEEFTFKTVFNAAFIPTFLVSSILALFYGIVFSIQFDNWLFFVIAILCPPLLSTIVALIYATIKYDNKMLIVKNKLINSENTLEQNNRDLAQAEKELAEAQIFSKELIAHADTLDKNAAEIENALQKNYALNLVPPDYRRLQCLVWIDYAFRNDQVDTMREATLQCDKWVRHNDVMTALRELAENIRSVAVLLEDMNANIAMMNQDLLNITQAQEKQLSETKSARYAMESVKRSTEKLEWYENLKYFGTFK